MCHNAPTSRGVPDDDEPRRRMGVWRGAALEFSLKAVNGPSRACRNVSRNHSMASSIGTGR